jgi:hypothetical protein
MVPSFITETIHSEPVVSVTNLSFSIVHTPKSRPSSFRRLDGRVETCPVYRSRHQDVTDLQLRQHDSGIEFTRIYDLNTSLIHYRCPDTYEVDYTGKTECDFYWIFTRRRPKTKIETPLVYDWSVNPSSLGFSLSSHRHSYISLLFSSRFIVS